MSETLAREVADVRAFNRFYTRVIGVLRANLLDSPYSLTEVRVLYELAAQPSTEGIDGAGLRRSLQLDTGYFSRILAKLQEDGLLRRQPSATDARRQLVALTDRGREVFRELDQRQVTSVHELLAPLPAANRTYLTEAMGAIRLALGDRPASATLRAPEPGDLGWVVARNGALYAREQGWSADYEALVARIVADYAGRPSTGREAGWIAELAGQPAGAVFCMTENDYTARLRLLHVEPFARGTGLGARLVEQCLRFARTAGYRRITLWTVSALGPARHIYQRAGFTLDDSSPFAAFGHQLTQQNWSREL